MWQHWECLYFFILERFLEVGPRNWIHWFCQKKELEFWQSTDLVLLGPSVSLGITASEPMTTHCWGTILILWCWWIGKIDSQNLFLVKQAVEHGLYLDRIQLSHFPKEWSFLVKKKIAEENWVHLEGSDEKLFKNVFQTKHDRFLLTIKHEKCMIRCAHLLSVLFDILIRIKIKRQSMQLLKGMFFHALNSPASGVHLVLVFLYQRRND